MLIDLFLYRGYCLCQFSARGIAGNNELAAQVLSVDGVGTGRRDHVSHIAERNLGSRRSVQHEILDPFHRGTGVVLDFEGKVEGTVAFVDGGDSLSFEHDLHEFGKLR